MNSSSAYSNVLLTTPVSAAANGASRKNAADNDTSADFGQTLKDVKNEASSSSDAHVPEKKTLEKAGNAVNSANSQQEQKPATAANQSKGADKKTTSSDSDNNKSDKAVSQSDKKTDADTDAQSSDTALIAQTNNPQSIDPNGAATVALVLPGANDGKAEVKNDADADSATAGLKGSTSVGDVLTSTEDKTSVANDKSGILSPLLAAEGGVDLGLKVKLAKAGVLSKTSDQGNNAQGRLDAASPLLAPVAQAPNQSPLGLVPPAPQTSAASIATSQDPGLGQVIGTVTNDIVNNKADKTSDTKSAEAATDADASSLLSTVAVGADSSLDKQLTGETKAAFEKMLQNLTTSSAGSGSTDTGTNNQSTSTTATAGITTAMDSLMKMDNQTPAARSFVVQTAVDVPVGQPQWSQAVGEKVLWLAAQNVSSAEIHLHPQDLGPLQVKVSVGQEQQANISFTSHHAVVREVLDQNMGRLRDMFAEQGLNLGSVDVSDKSFQRQQGEGKEQQGQGGGGDLTQEEEAPVAVTPIISPRLVDHYA